MMFKILIFTVEIRVMYLEITQLGFLLLQSELCFLDIPQLGLSR